MIFYLPQIVNIVTFLLEEKVDLTYEEGPGNHEWDFWDRYILKNFRLASFKIKKMKV